MQPAPQKQMTPRAWALLSLLAVIWGGSFVSNRAALTELPVLWVVALRVSAAALVLWVYVLARGGRVPLRIGQFLIMGALSCALPFSLIVWGQQHIESGLAAILNAATAIFGVFAGAIAFSDERLSARKLTGALIGMVGVILCVGPAALKGFSLASLGQIAVLGSSVSYTAANLYARNRIQGLAPEVVAAGMLTGASLFMLPLALALDGWPGVQHGPQVWAGLAWLVLVSTALSYILYYRVLAEVGTANFGPVTLMIPPVAIALGALFYGEALSLWAWLGFGVLALGLLITNERK